MTTTRYWLENYLIKQTLLSLTWSSLLLFFHLSLFLHYFPNVSNTPLTVFRSSLTIPLRYCFLRPTHMHSLSFPSLCLYFSLSFVHVRIMNHFSLSSNTHQARNLIFLLDVHAGTTFFIVIFYQLISYSFEFHPRQMQNWNIAFCK